MNLARLIPIYFVVFAGFAGYSVMITVFTPMFLDGYGRLIPPETAIGTKTILLGITLCMYPLGQFVSAPIIGALSDKYGRKRILLVSLALSICAYVVVADAIDQESLPVLIAALIVAGLSEGNIVIAQSAISDISDRANRGRLFAYVYMSASLAYVIGPLVGGKLASPTVVPWFSYSTPFWAMPILLGGTLVATALVFQETRAPDASAQIRLSAALTNLAAVFRPSPVRTIYLANFAFYLGIFGFFRCYPMYLVDEFHLGVSKVSEFIGWLSVPLILGTVWLAGFFSARFPAAKVTIWSGVLTALTMTLIVIPSSENALWITLFLAGLPLSICLPACATTLSIAVPAEEQGRALGNNQALQVFAESASVVVAGVIAAWLIKAPIVAMAVFVLIGVAILLISAKKDSRWPP